ncbi:hypothetical protein [Umezawaea sp. NPDC059074]|uniref:hypothetical protein n=1 Tax=Umezawaea sp. NPDC059074 TaxID=3346716 RepID=UPI0036CE2285
MQRNSRLPSPRPPFHHQHTRMVEPNDLVLLNLNSRNDVPHDLFTRRVQRRSQRNTIQRQLIVVKIVQPPPPRTKVPPLHQPLRRSSRGHVERPSGRRPPIGQQRLIPIGFVEQPDPPDVRPTTVDMIGPPEAQPVISDPQPTQLIGQGPHIDLPLPPLRRHIPQSPLQRTQRHNPLPVELLVQECDAFTLREQFLHVQPDPSVL